VFFHLNHPIRFVSIVAPIVEIEHIGEKYGLFRLDDGSGATIVAKLNLLDKSISSQADCPSNTVISNVTYSKALGTFDVEVDGQELDIGTVVKAKCTIEVFRKETQLVLKRLSLVKSTSEEVRHWKEIAQWKTGVLSRPWSLTTAEVAALERREIARVEAVQKTAESRKAKQKKRKAEEMVKDQKRESKRRLREIAMNEGALI
jgi:hypothetical protein